MKTLLFILLVLSPVVTKSQESPTNQVFIDNTITNQIPVSLPPMQEQLAYFWAGFDSGSYVWGTVGCIWGLRLAFQKSGFTWNKD